MALKTMAKDFNPTVFSHSKDTWSNSHNLAWSFNVNAPASIKNERYDR